MNIKTLGGKLIIFGAGAIVGAMYKDEKGVTVVDKALSKIEAETLKGIERIKNAKGKNNKRTDVSAMREKVTEFYKGTLQCNSDNLSFGKPIEDETAYTFDSYPEAKVNLLDYLVDNSDCEAESKKEIYSLIMDYGNFVTRKLNEKEQARCENINLSE